MRVASYQEDKLPQTNMRKLRLSCQKKENLKRWKVLEGSKLINRLEKSLFQTVTGKSARHHLARSRRSDSGERCEVKRSAKK